MNTVEIRNESYSDDSGRRTFSLLRSTRFHACAVVIFVAASAPSVLADPQVYGYVGPMGLVSHSNILSDERTTAVRRKAR